MEQANGKRVGTEGKDDYLLWVGPTTCADRGRRHDNYRRIKLLLLRTGYIFVRYVTLLVGQSIFRIRMFWM